MLKTPLEPRTSTPYKWQDIFFAQARCIFALLSSPSNSFTFIVVTQFCMVSCYKLLKLMSNVKIQAIKKLGWHNAIDSKVLRLIFSFIAVRYKNKKSLGPIQFVFFVKLGYKLQRERFWLFVNKNVPKKCAIKKCLAMNFVKNSERGQAGVSTFF